MGRAVRHGGAEEEAKRPLLPWLFNAAIGASTCGVRTPPMAFPFASSLKTTGET